MFCSRRKSFRKRSRRSRSAGRSDYRGLDIVTIDGETARDFDDAVWVDRLPNGNYELHVHIADVSYYVRPGYADRSTRRAMRGTSVYFPDRAVPMLPVELSTELCSLKPQVDRLVLSAILEIDNKGDVVEPGLHARRHPQRRADDVHRRPPDARRRRRRCASATRALVDRFELMKELAMKLNRKRVKRGSIDFDLPERRSNSIRRARWSA